jgi:hypothetical protein
MGPTALLPLQRKWCSGFLSPLKIHRPRSGSNPRTLGPVASTLTVECTRGFILWKRKKSVVKDYIEFSNATIHTLQWNILELTPASGSLNQPTFQRTTLSLSFSSSVVRVVTQAVRIQAAVGPGSWKCANQWGWRLEWPYCVAWPLFPLGVSFICFSTLVMGCHSRLKVKPSSMLKFFDGLHIRMYILCAGFALSWTVNPVYVIKLLSTLNKA